MVSTKNERLTKAYVDNAVEVAMDAQRQYSETLFSKAEKRVNLVLDERLKTALATIRPETSIADVEYSSTKMPLVSKQNVECLSVLKAKMAALVQQYELATGFRVRCAYFDHRTEFGGTIMTKLLVHNV